MLSYFVLLWAVMAKHLVVSNAKSLNTSIGTYVTSYFGSTSCTGPSIFQESFALGRCLQLINGSSIEVFCIGHDKHGILVRMFPSSVSCTGVHKKSVYPINSCIHAKPFIHNSALSSIDISSFAAICTLTPGAAPVPDYLCSNAQSPLNPITTPDNSCQSSCFDVYPQCKQPSGQPTATPTNPTGQPSHQPSALPTNPSGQPSRQPSRQPSSTPTNPSGQPSRQPSRQLSSLPTNPTGQPSRQPSRQPSAHPSARLAQANTFTNTCPTELIFTNPTIYTSTSSTTTTTTNATASTNTNTTAAHATRTPSNTRTVIESMVGSGSGHGGSPHLLANGITVGSSQSLSPSPSPGPSPGPGPSPSPGSGAFPRALANRTHVLVFALTQRNLAHLESVLRSVSDPNSAKYGQYLTREEVHRTNKQITPPHPPPKPNHLTYPTLTSFIVIPLIYFTYYYLLSSGGSPDVQSPCKGSRCGPSAVHRSYHTFQCQQSPTP